MRVTTPSRIEHELHTSEIVRVNEREDYGDITMDAIPPLLKQEKGVVVVEERD